MADKNFSCIKQVVKTVQIPLPSMFISNEISGITEILDSWKRQYSKQLQSVVVNYRNLSLSPSGYVVPNKQFVYYNVKATFDLFCPKIGDIVKGMITRISKEHISCVIEGTISVSIHLSSDSPKDFAPFISLNREILFEISSMKFDEKMILNVKGKITHKCVELMKEFFPAPAFHSLIDTPEFSNNTDEGIGTSSESADDGLQNHVFDDSKINDDVNFKKPFSTSKKSKKSKKPKSDSESSTMDTSDVSTSNEKPKKKKKKHNDESRLDVGDFSSGKKLLSNTVSSNSFIQNFSDINHPEIKEEDLSSEDNIHVKKHKKKHKLDSSPSLLGETSLSKSQTLSQELSNLDLNNSAGDGALKLIQNFSNISHSEIKEEDLSLEGNIHVKKHKKKHIWDSSPSLLGETSLSKSQTLSQDLSNLNLNNSAGAPKLSKKRKRESESPFMYSSDQSTADEMPKKKKKHKDKTVPLEQKEIKREFSDVPDDETIVTTLLSLKQEKLSPVKKSVNSVPESKKKKKSKEKKSKDKDKTKSKDEDKTKKKKGKVLASGAVLKKDKKSKKKGSKKKKPDGEQSKKHKKSKSHKKDKSDKKKKESNSKNKVSNVIKSEFD